MCFHRWPFIERGLFGNPSGRPLCPLCLPTNTKVIGMSHQAALVSSSPPSSFLPPLSSPPVAGATGIAYVMS
ncbi:hypothetical protein MTR_7g090430 [Medicago truncatula]|uniref:Uncharacterized protein n=1 Tax=Medicago truncatula TaxID=3880 RepID=G7KRQ2_MEDTR|nr:hypothetical protein MTR_7g090430 [Medicago truncatula]